MVQYGLDFIGLEGPSSFFSLSIFGLSTSAIGDTFKYPSALAAFRISESKLSTFRTVFFDTGSFASSAVGSPFKSFAISTLTSEL